LSFPTTAKAQTYAESSSYPVMQFIHVPMLSSVSFFKFVIKERISLNDLEVSRRPDLGSIRKEMEASGMNSSGLLC
jgi:hypothetical protein